MLQFLELLARMLFFSLRLGTESSFPRALEPEEERELLLRSASGDADARGKLIEHNLRLVAHIIKKYYSSASDQDDLISIGVIGLIKAIRTFDVKKNTRLATYAARCVENEIFMHFRTMRRMSCEMSLSEPIDTDPEGNTLELMDVLCDSTDMLDDVIRADRAGTLHRRIAELLDPREKEIVTLRYGLGGVCPLPQREVAARLGISRSYVSRIETRALGKLREGMEV